MEAKGYGYPFFFPYFMIFPFLVFLILLLLVWGFDGMPFIP